MLCNAISLEPTDLSALYLYLYYISNLMQLGLTHLNVTIVKTTKHCASFFVSCAILPGDLVWYSNTCERVLIGACYMMFLNTIGAQHAACIQKKKEAQCFVFLYYTVKMAKCFLEQMVGHTPNKIWLCGMPENNIHCVV